MIAKQEPSYSAEQLSMAVPAKHFALPPYHAELFSKDSGWAGVMNKNGLNVLTFPSKPGAVISDFDYCNAVAELWNAQIKI